MAPTLIAQFSLENVELSFWPHILGLRGDLRIRSVFVDERNNLTQNFEPNFDTACVIEESALPSELDKIESSVRKVFRALILYEDRLIRYSRIISNASSLRSITPARDVALMTHQSNPSWRHALQSSHMFPLRLDTRNKAERFKTFWEAFDSSTRPEYFEMAISRFSYATDMIATKSLWAYRPVEYVTSLEALLTHDEPEISYKLPLRAVALLGGSKKERVFTFEFLRQAYTVRSKVVHGAEARQLRKVLPMKINHSSLNPNEVNDMLHTLCQRSLRSVFGLLRSKSIDAKKDSLEDLLDRRIITGSN
jgi:hypothetical protein